MEFFANVLRVLDTPMETPVGYDWFHLLWWAITLGAAVGLCLWHRKSGNVQRVRNVVFGVAVTVIILEIYKMINFGFSYEDGVSYSFPWGSFPWQFCSIPMYAAINAPKGSPGPAKWITPSTKTVPAVILPAKAPTIPAVAEESTTSGASLNL